MQALLVIRARQAGGPPLRWQLQKLGCQMCTSSFQSDAGDLVLLLEQARGIRWGKCLPAPPGSGMDCSQSLDVC